MANAFLGRGLRFPIEADATGALRLAEAEDKVRDSVLLILATVQGERQMRPDFGSRLQEQVFGLLRASTYSPAWSAPSDRDELGVALTGLFARLLELLISRLNRAPFKHELAFFNLLGIDRLPGNPARTPVRFFIPAGNRDGGVVRAGTQV